MCVKLTYSWIAVVSVGIHMHVHTLKSTPKYDETAKIQSFLNINCIHRKRGGSQKKNLHEPPSKMMQLPLSFAISMASIRPLDPFFIQRVPCAYNIKCRRSVCVSAHRCARTEMKGPGIICNRMQSACKLQGGEDAQDAPSCKSLCAEEPLIIGLFCGK